MDVQMTFYKFWNIFNIKEFVDIFFSLFVMKKKMHTLKNSSFKNLSNSFT